MIGQIASGWVEAATFAGWLYLLWHSRVRRTPRYFTPMLVGWLLIFAGALFKLAHWSWSTELLLLGAFLLWAPYALWTWQCRPLQLLPALKLAWITSMSWGVVTSALHLSVQQYVAAASTVLFWAVLLLAAYQNHIRTRLAN